MRGGWIIPGLPVARIGLFAALVYGHEHFHRPRAGASMPAIDIHSL